MADVKKSIVLLFILFGFLLAAKESPILIYRLLLGMYGTTICSQHSLDFRLKINHREPTLLFKLHMEIK